MTRAVKASDPLVQQRTVNTRTSCAPTPCLRSRESLAATGLLSVKPASSARSVSRQALMDSFLSRCMDLATSVPTVPPAVAIPVAGVLAMWMLAWADAKRLTSKPKLTYQSTKFNEGILSRIPTLRSPYKPLPFLTNGHVETIFAAKARKKVDIEYRRENLHMPDGGVVSLDWRVPKEGDLVRKSSFTPLLLQHMVSSNDSAPCSRGSAATPWIHSVSFGTALPVHSMFQLVKSSREWSH